MIEEDFAQDSLSALQNQRFCEVIPHIFDTPFYRDKYQRLSFGGKNINTLDDLVNLPFTTKEELRTCSPFGRSPHPIAQLEYLFSSSGTSGKPTLYFWTKKDSAVLRVAGERAMRRIGVDEDDIALVVAPMGLPIMWYCMIQQFSAVGAGVIPLGVGPPEEVIKTMSHQPVSILISPPVIVSRLFEFLSKHNHAATESIGLRQIHCGGDFLSNIRRHRIEQDWGVDCYNFFGMSEILGPLAGECDQKDGMHLLADYVYVEVLNPDTGQPVEAGVPGVAVYTTLWNKGAPLVRYWSDDFVVMETRPCRCGRTSPRIRFLGRPEDMVVLNGRRIFASELEEHLLSFQVGCEYALTIKPDSTASFDLEEMTSARVTYTDLQERLTDFLEIPVDINVLPPGAIPRNGPKPRRIVVKLD